MDMKYCTNCGEKKIDGNHFCVKCGEKYVLENIEDPEKTKETEDKKDTFSVENNDKEKIDFNKKKYLKKDNHNTENIIEFITIEDLFIVDIVKNKNPDLTLNQDQVNAINKVINRALAKNQLDSTKDRRHIFNIKNINEGLGIVYKLYNPKKISEKLNPTICSLWLQELNTGGFYEWINNVIIAYNYIHNDKHKSQDILNIFEMWSCEVFKKKRLPIPNDNYKQLRQKYYPRPSNNNLLYIVVIALILLSGVIYYTSNKEATISKTETKSKELITIKEDKVDNLVLAIDQLEETFNEKEYENKIEDEKEKKDYNFSYEYYIEGITLMKSANYKDAIDKFRTALIMYNSNSIRYNFNKADIKKALEECNNKLKVIERKNAKNKINTAKSNNESIDNTKKENQVTKGNYELTDSDDNFEIDDRYPREDITTPFAVVEIPPVFPGCESEKSKGATAIRICFNEMMQKHILKHFKYPELAIEMGIQGRVFIQFTIKNDGNIGNIRYRGPDRTLEDEALRIIKKLPRLTPGIQSGSYVNVPFSIPISFELE